MKKVRQLVFLVAIVFAGIGSIITYFLTSTKCNQEIEKYNQKPYLELKLLEAEKESRADQIEIKKEELFGKYDGLLSSNYRRFFTAEIVNNSLLAKAKDIQIEITFYSKTKSVIGKEKLIVYQYISPKSSISIKEEVNYDEDIVESFSTRILEVSTE